METRSRYFDSMEEYQKEIWTQMGQKNTDDFDAIFVTKAFSLSEEF